MKRLFVLFATVTLLIGVQACKQKPAEDTTEAVADSTAVTVTDSAVVTVPAAVGDSKNITPPTDPPPKKP